MEKLTPEIVETEVISVVQYATPNSGCCPRMQHEEIESRDLKLATQKAPTGSYAFCFLDLVRVTVKHGDDEMELTSGPCNYSKSYFFDGQVYDLDGVRALGPEFQRVIENMESNGITHAIRCRTGNWQPFRIGDDARVDSMTGELITDEMVDITKLRQ